MDNHTGVFGAFFSREDALFQLKKYPKSYNIFMGFDKFHQEKLLGFLQGKNSIKITYDNFFKYIFDPSVHKDRLERLLSVLIGENVQIKKVLPREGVQLTEKGSLVIMDIIAELEDGSIIDIEMQKIGYEFSGERSSCYTSDMIMRQYNRVKNEKGKSFSYKNLKPVYLIILMEDSPSQFHTDNTNYIHHRCTYYDSGIKLPDLAKVTYISLDTFSEIVQNIDTELEAWLTFLSSENLDKINELIGRYPEFLEYYKEIAEFRTKPEELINMFSEALAILDRNTALYMIEERDKEIEERDKKIEEIDKKIEERDKEINVLKRTIEEEMQCSRQQLQEKEAEIQKLKEMLEQQK